MTTIELSAAYNWCDRRCERCPLQDGCPVFTRAPVGVEETLREAVALVEERCRDEGIVVDDQPPPPPGPMEYALQRAGYEWAAAHHALGGLDLTGVVVAAKVVRIACEDDFDDDDLRSVDVHPNLLVVERLLDEARAAVDARRASASAAALARFDAADRALRGLLAPLFDAIPELERAAIEVLAAAGRAPSPFCR